MYGIGNKNKGRWQNRKCIARHVLFLGLRAIFQVAGWQFWGSRKLTTYWGEGALRHAFGEQTRKSCLYIHWKERTSPYSGRRLFESRPIQDDMLDIIIKAIY